MKTYFYFIFFSLIALKSAAQSPIALADAIWEDLFKSTLTEERFDQLDAVIAEQDPNGKYPEWALRSLTLKGWYSFEYKYTSYNTQELIAQGNAFLDHAEAQGISINRKEWILAKADFYEWAGRVLKSINDDKYRTLLYLHQAYTIKRQFYPQNHPEMMRLLFFFVLHHHNPAEAVEISEFLYATYEQDSTLKANPFAAFYETSIGFYKALLFVYDYSKKEEDQPGIAHNKTHMASRERAYLNMVGHWGENAIYAKYILSTLVGLLKDYGTKEKHDHYEQLLRVQKMEAKKGDSGNGNAGSPPPFSFAFANKFAKQAEEILAETHQYMAYYNPLIEANDVHSPSPNSLPDEMLQEMASFWSVMGQKVHAYGRAYLNGNELPNQAHLEAVCGWVDMCQYMILHLLNQHQIRHPKHFNVNLHQETFKEGFRAAIALFQLTGQKQWLEKAYSFATFGKNFRLYALHLTEERFNSSEQMKALSRQINTHTLAAEDFRQQGYFAHFDSLSARYAKVFQLVKKQDSLLFKLRDADLFSYPVEVKENLVQQLQSKLKPDEALIEFFPDSAYQLSHGALFVKKDTIIWQPFSASYADLQATYTTYKNAIANRNEEYQQASLALYQLLIAPQETAITDCEQLYLLPNYPLEDISFAALRDANNRFMVERFRLASHFNARLLAKSLGMELETITNFSGFAPFGLENTPAGEAYPAAFRQWLAVRLAHAEDSTFLQMALPATFQEISSIASRYSQKNILTQGQATESQFKAMAQKPSILHLASHAIVEKDNPGKSRVLFYPEDGDNNDGALHLYELPFLNIQSPLVVLSACQTGVAGQSWLNMHTYSDLKSLAFGFSAAGVPNQLVSLWNIADEPSAYLMERFHDHLTNGKPMAESLQQAQIDYLQNPKLLQKYKHPYYWSGYRLMGTNQTVVRPWWQEFTWQLTSSLIIILVLLLGWKVKRG